MSLIMLSLDNKLISNVMQTRVNDDFSWTGNNYLSIFLLIVYRELSKLKWTIPRRICPKSLNMQRNAFSLVTDVCWCTVALKSTWLKCSRAANKPKKNRPFLSLSFENQTNQTGRWTQFYKNDTIFSYSWDWQCRDRCSVGSSILGLPLISQTTTNWVSGGCILADHAMLSPYYHKCSKSVDPAKRLETRFWAQIQLAREWDYNLEDTFALRTSYI